MTQVIHRCWRDERAATAIEYALIASFIALAIIVATRAVGVELVTVFQAVASGYP